MKCKNYGLLLIVLIYSGSAFSIVDYSEPVNVEAPPAAVNKSTTVQKIPSKETKSLIWKSDISFTSNFESIEIESKKLGVYNLNTHWQMPFNVYLDLAYWSAKDSNGFQNGNPKTILGFNWLRLGSPNDEARFDIYGGAKIAGNSNVASSRTDSIFGIETTKRFFNFGIGFGYELNVVGTPKNNQDMSIGNIHRISVSSGWLVSNDIQFELELENFKISPAEDKTKSNYLEKNISFSTFSPKLVLTLAPAVNIEMGARFQTNKPKTDKNLSSAKLYDLHGAYGNSLFAGLSLNM